MSQDIKPSLFFVANLMNFVLATGIFTLPFSLYESGIFLGSIVLIITCGISIIACTFIIEALGTQNCFIKQENAVLNRASILRNSLVNNVDSTLLVDEKSQVFFEDNLKRKSHTFTAKDNAKLNLDVKENEVADVNTEVDEEENDAFYIFKRIEISKMANKVFSKPVYFFIVISMICYLYIGLTSNGMIAGKSIHKIFSKTIGHDLPHHWYIIIVSSFYALVMIIALNNINHLRKLSMIVMLCRFVMILLIFVSCIYSIINNGAAQFDKIPKFELQNITVIIGNSLFLFMSHHSMPGMVENFRPQKNLIKLIVIAYISSLILMLGYGYISLIAFAHLSNCDTDVFPCAIQSTFSLNFLSLKIVGYIINYYPLLNIITTALIAITLKNNILQAIGTCSLDLYKSLNFAEKQGFVSSLLSLLFNLIICLPSISAAILLPDIQQLMKYFSSIFGFIIMIIVPTILVYGFRKKFEKTNLKGGVLNRSFLKHNGFLIAIGCLGAVILSLILYGFFNSANKTCVAE